MSATGARAARGWVYVQNQGDGTVLLVGSTRTGDGSPNPLRFGSERTHQFVIGQITLTPSAVIATDALRGSGAGGLATSDHDLVRMLSQGECLLAPTSVHGSGALGMAALMFEPATAAATGPPDAAASPGGELASLYAVADDDQASLLDELAVRAGLRWRCVCGFLNPAEHDGCEGCPLPRPAA